MTAEVPKPPNAARVNFRVAFSCTCGAERSVFAQGLATDLPVSERWRDTGGCAGCGLDSRWRILDDPGAYRVEIEVPDAAVV